jgi:hypothetical protein
MKFDRRHFLTLGGMAGAYSLLNDFNNVSNKIAEGIFSNAYAQQVGAKRILSIFAQGAVPTWMFNLCLYPDAQIIPSAYRIEGVGTGFDASGKTIFEQSKRGNYFFPRMWFTPIPTVSGQWVSPASLLDNMLTIRGIWNPTDGHQIANRMAFKPLGANASVHGIIADAMKSKYPIPAIVTGNGLISKEFSSLEGINPLASGNPTNAMNTIRDSFKEQVSLFRNKDIDPLIKSALDKMSTYSSYKKSSANFNRQKADELIRSNLANVVTEYNTRKIKYASLYQQAVKYDPSNSNTIIPGIFENPITNTSSLQWGPNNDSSFNRSFQANSDLRELFLTPMESNQNATSDVNSNNIAAAFAMAEVLFEYNLNSNIIADIQGVITLTSSIILQTTTNLPFANNRSPWAFDNGHSIGVSLQTLIWSVHLRGYLTCMYEFIQFLKLKNLFNDTVLTFSTDFGRSPFSNGLRSDHGWRANTLSMWNSEITEPTIIGNTMLDASSVESSNYKNLWGVGRKSDFLGNYIGIGNMNSSIATIVGVDPNTKNNRSMIKKENGGIVPLETAKTT